MHTPWVQIRDIPKHADAEVTVRGWVYNKRSSGKIQFLQLRDGTGTIQGVMVKKEVSPEAFETAKNLWIEASVAVTVTVVTPVDTDVPAAGTCVMTAVPQLFVVSASE